MKNTNKYDPYDPENFDSEAWQEKRKRQTGIIVGILAIALVSILGTTGVFRWRVKETASPEIPSATATINTAEFFSTLYLADTVTDTALLLVGSEGAYIEIKIADVTTDTVRIQDLTRGKFQASAAALSPSGNQVAYIREEANKRTVEVIDRSGQSQTVKEVNYWVATRGKTAEPCFWSPIAWSPDGQHIAFFACNNTLSMLIVVEVAANNPLPVNKTTHSAYPGPRQLIWFDDDSLIHTQYNPDTDTTTAYRLFLDAKIDPVLVYER